MLSVAALHAHYGASHVLQGVDLEVAAGQVVAVLGRNGVGKTTALRALIGLLAPSRGQVRLDGVEIAGWPAHRIARAGIAYVPEGRLIFPDLTVLLVEHDMDVVFRLAHAITVLHRGAVIADGPPDAVRADPAVQRAYLGGLD